jgi:hypothetical protein
VTKERMEEIALKTLRLSILKGEAKDKGYRHHRRSIKEWARGVGVSAGQFDVAWLLLRQPNLRLTEELIRELGPLALRWYEYRIRDYGIDRINDDLYRDLGELAQDINEPLKDVAGTLATIIIQLVNENLLRIGRPIEDQAG